MTKADSMWQPYRLEAAGLNINLYRAWPEALAKTETGGVLYQRILDSEGLLFARYGREETIEEFIATLDDLVTTVTILKDEKLVYLGQDARRVTLLTERQSLGIYKWQGEALNHSETPAERTIVSVVGFRRQGLPVLVGYRIPEEELSTHEEIGEKFLTGVAVI